MNWIKCSDVVPLEGLPVLIMLDFSKIDQTDKKGCSVAILKDGIWNLQLGKNGANPSPRDDEFITHWTPIEYPKE